MKITSAKIIILLTTLLLASCNNRGNENSRKKPETITINPESNKNILLSNIVKDIKIVCLETNENCLISDVDKLRYFDGNFYVFDEVGLKRLLRFDEKGKFIDQIGARGKGGNGEYITPRDMNINPWEKRVEIYDILNNKILFYNLAGEYTGFYNVDKKARAYTIIDSLNYGFFLDAAFENISYNFCTSSTNEFVCNNRGIPFRGQRDVMNGINLFYESDYGILFSYSLNSTIYRISSTGAQATYNINYENNTIPEDILKSGMHEIVDYLADKKMPGFISNFGETSKYFTFSYTFDCFDYNIVFVNKTTGDTKNLYKPINDINHLPFPPPFCTIDEEFVTVVPAHEIILTYQEMLTEKKDSTEVFSTDAFKRFEAIASNIHEDDNPILIRYTLKDF